jgi:hypothetical protein
MATLLTVALICAATVPQPECNRETALDVIVSPAGTPFQCLMQGQTLAASAFTSTFSDGRYLRVTCEHRRASTVSKLEQGE